MSSVLALVLTLGFWLTYKQAVGRIESETRAAVSTARKAAHAVIDDALRAPDPQKALSYFLRSFDGSRHLQVALISARGQVETSIPAEEESAAPEWFETRVSPELRSEIVELPTRLAPAIAIRLQPHPSGEIAEIWEELGLKLGLLSGLSLSMLLSAWMITRAVLRPLPGLIHSMERIGAGDYAARAVPVNSPEMQRVSTALNAMAERLEQAKHVNRSLTEKILSVQEEERAGLARDLHDGIGPLLFAVDVDAMKLEEQGGDGDKEGREQRLRSIRDAVTEMKSHVTALLARLRPEVALDLGLAHAVEQLTSAARARHSGIAIEADVPMIGWSRDIDEAIYFVIREGINNVLRHARASRIKIAAQQTVDGNVRVSLRDNGRGLDKAGNAAGFGIRGMKERVARVNGTLSIRNRADGPGTELLAVMPAPLPSGWLADLRAGEAA
jgi:two-component system sensor histidine kinase UhpB